MRRLANNGADCITHQVQDVMTTDLIIAVPEDELSYAMNIMTEKRIRHLPVMDGDEMTGLISIGDVVKARLSELAMEKDALEGMIMGH